MSLFHSRAYLLFRELRRALRPRRKVAAGGHDLDHRRPGFYLLARRLARFGRSVALAAYLPAVTAGHRDHLAAGQQSAAFDQSFVDKLFQLDVDVVIAAEVTDEGHAAVERLFEVDRAAMRYSCVAVASHEAGKIRFGIYRDVDVRVYDAGSYVLITVVDQLRSGWSLLRDLLVFSGAYDQAVFQQQSRADGWFRARAVDQRSAFYNGVHAKALFHSFPPRRLKKFFTGVAEAL